MTDGLACVRHQMPADLVARAERKARKRAEEAQRKVKERKLTPHFENTLERHRVGILGEYGTFHWLGEQGYAPKWTGDERGACDVICEGRRFEIKTRRSGPFIRFGWCVAESQLKAIAKRSDLVWFVELIGNATVVFHGWGRPYDFTAPAFQAGTGQTRDLELPSEHRRAPLDWLA